MAIDKSNILDLENWNEITKGLYRYVISANATYEIHIKFRSVWEDINEAQASLYLAGEWIGQTNGDYFERELLLDGVSSERTVKECLEAAYNDYKENVE